jgi:hypothetical protein
MTLSSIRMVAAAWGFLRPLAELPPQKFSHLLAVMNAVRFALPFRALGNLEWIVPASLKGHSAMRVTFD